MSLGDLRSLTLEVNEWAHGIDITIAVPGAETPIAGRGIWLSFTTPDVSDREAFQHWRDVRRVLSIARTTLDVVPTQSRIFAPERPGGEPRWWVVDGVAAKHADRTYVVLVPDPDS